MMPWVLTLSPVRTYELWNSDDLTGQGDIAACLVSFASNTLSVAFYPRVKPTTIVVHDCKRTYTLAAWQWQKHQWRKSLQQCSIIIFSNRKGNGLECQFFHCGVHGVRIWYKMNNIHNIVREWHHIGTMVQDVAQNDHIRLAVRYRIALLFIHTSIRIHTIIKRLCHHSIRLM